ncbi:cystatin-like fold lipoprotein, partial [Staphylococcus aureus]|nr:cystatin-like fold lipoprotein [Staphylococcus aureus]
EKRHKEEQKAREKNEIQRTKDREKMYYFAYEIKDGKAEINREIDPIKYMKDHKADYEDENVEVEKD